MASSADAADAAAPAQRTAHALEEQYAAAEKIGVNVNAVAPLQAILAATVEHDDVDGMRAKEHAVTRLGDVLCATKQPEALTETLYNVRPFLTLLPKAKAAKLVRRLFDQIFRAGASSLDLRRVCESMIQWAVQDKRVFLRHRLQHRLAAVEFGMQESIKALAIVGNLLKEVRRIEDISLLVDVHLLESKIYHAIKNYSKARAALVAARTNANAIYCPPLLQAEIDLQSGILSAEERDFKTSFSYMYEAFEGYHGLGDHSREARVALSCAILMKIATDNTEDLRAMYASKSVQQYTGPDMDALKLIAAAVKHKNVHEFNEVLEKQKADLALPFLQKHLVVMYDNLVEGHLLRIIKPYRRVQITFLAEAVNLSAELVEARLSQLILDKKLKGIVDQQYLCLVVYEEQHPTEVYKDALSTLANLDKLVTALFDKVAGKFDHLAEQQAKDAAGKKKDAPAAAAAGDKAARK